MILGGGGWSEAGVAALASFLDANDLPAACGFRRQDLLDNDHRCYAGHIGLGPNPKLAARIKAADLVLAIGARLGETTSQSFTLLDVPRPRQTFVHVHNDPQELGRVYQADLAIPSGLNAFAHAAAGLAPLQHRPWAQATADAHAEELAWRAPTRIAGSLQLGEIVAALARAPAAGHHRHQRRRQLRHLGQPPLRLSRPRHPAGADLGLDGLRPAGGGRRQAARIPSARSSASPATAAS